MDMPLLPLTLMDGWCQLLIGEADCDFHLETRSITVLHHRSLRRQWASPHRSRRARREARRSHWAAIPRPRSTPSPLVHRSFTARRGRLANHDDRTVSVHGAVLAHRTKEEPAEAAQSSTAYDEEVRASARFDERRGR